MMELNISAISSLNTIGLQATKPHSIYGERWCKVFPINEFDLEQGYTMQAGYEGMPADSTIQLDNIEQVEREMADFTAIEQWQECEF